MINYLKLLLAFFIVLQSCKGSNEIYISTSFREPANEGLRYIYSEDGLNWDTVPGVWLKPIIGNELVLRDPSITVSSDGVFHLVWTSSWKGDLGFGYAESKDLIHWSEPRMISVMKNEPSTINVWAPDIFYDDEKQEYIVVWASCIPYKFPKGIEEEDNNHRLYYITTKDFKTISKTKLLYDPGFSSIDATIVKRGKNDYVLVFKDNTRPNRNLKVAFAKSPTGPYSKPSDAFTQSFVEGPTVEKVGEDYLIYFDEYREFTYGAVKTRDFIHFQNISEEVSVPKGHKHGTIFKASSSILGKMKKSYEIAQEKNVADETKKISSQK